MLKISTYLTLFALFAIALPVAAQMEQETISSIAAVVNDEIITTRQIDKRIQEQPAGAQHISQAEMLNKMITEILMQQRAAELGISVSKEEVDHAIKDVEQQNNITTEQLEQALAAQGLGMRQYREQLQAQILRFKLTGIEVKRKADVTTHEMQEYYEQHLDDYLRPARMRLSRISLPLPPQGKAVYAAAEAMRKEMEQGKKVEDILAAQPQTLGADGGDMGYFKPGELSPVFNSALDGLSAGEVTDIIQNGDVLHILRIEESTPGRTAEFAEVKDEIAKLLRERKIEEKLESWRQQLRGKAYIEKRI